MKSRSRQLLAFATELQRASTFGELVVSLQAEVERAVGYKHAWMFVADPVDLNCWRMIDFAGAKRADAWEVAHVLHVNDDVMLQEIARGDAPVVVADARTDPRTDKKIVAQLGNRTIINIPLRLVDKPLGAFGTGTFGDEEGCRPPTDAQLDYLMDLAAQLSVAAGRIRFQEERRHEEQLRQKMIVELQESQERLHQAVRARDEFLSLASHELKTPLTSLRLKVESALRVLDRDPSKPVDGELLRARLDALPREVDRITALINNLLEVSNIASGRLVLEPRPLDLREVVEEAVAALRPELARSGSEVQVLAAGPVRGAWDRRALGSVLLNVLSNAIRFGRGKPISVEIDALSDQARVVVTDQGVGIDPSEQERIFHLFERGMRPLEPGGLGMGLWIARRIVEAHGGKIHVASKLGAGAIFTIVIPLEPIG